MKNKINNQSGFTLIELYFAFPYSIALSFQFGMILNIFYQNMLIAIIGGVIFYPIIMFLPFVYGGATAGINKKNKNIKNFFRYFVYLFLLIPLIVFPYFFLNESIFIIILNFVLGIPVIAILVAGIYFDYFDTKKK